MRFFSNLDKKLLLTRLTGLLLILTSSLQLAYFALSTNPVYPVFGVIFVGAIFLTLLSTVISVANSWFYSQPSIVKLKPGNEPAVGVIIPTCGEPVEMVLKTLNSVLEQNWPKEKLIVIVSDDAKNMDLKKEVTKIRRKNPQVLYYLPPALHSEQRKGAAKAGNLNAALAFLLGKHPELEFVETRDADDLVGDHNFLRFCVGKLISDPKIGFVQTIKLAQVNPGDPFSNQEALFYERTMRYRAAVNSIFPCGSGLVWRKTELQGIGGFPTWNLVEDLQSGYECLKLGGTGEYLPIIGAIGQSAPEDIPNYYKQRGTWAIDALRLFFWKNALFAKKLTIWQRLQFFELGFSYLLSLIMLVFVFAITSCLGYSVCPTVNDSAYMLLVSGLFIVSLELYNLVRARGLAYEETLKIRQTWVGLLPVFTIAIFKALSYGPNKKPGYKVTRKTFKAGIYLKEVIPQIFILYLLAFSMIHKLLHFETMQNTDVILFFWSGFLGVGLTKVIRNSLFGVKPILGLREKVDIAYNAA